MTRIILDDDFVDPAKEDWRSMDDSAVYHAAKAGVRQAQVELQRRELADRNRQS